VIEQPRRHELFDPRYAHGRGDRLVLAETSRRASDESYDQLAAEAVAENEGMPARLLHARRRCPSPAARSRLAAAEEA
jgi:hypothetical protein